MVDTQNLAAPSPPGPMPPRAPHGRRTVIVIVAVAAVIAIVATVALVRNSSIPSAPVIAGTPPAGSAAADHQWPLVVADEFDGGSLDQNVWDVYHGQTTGDVGTQSPDAVTVGDGSLQISARGNVSGGLSMDKGQTYGRWEFRAKAQAAVGYGPVVLLWPDSDRWPLDGEIDVMEIPKPERAVNNFTVHYGADNTQDAVTQNGDFSQWHDYAVEWEPDHITAWIDGKQIFTTTNRAEIPTGPMHIAIQEDIGPIDNWIPAPDDTTPSTVKLDIDWVHVYGR